MMRRRADASGELVLRRLQERSGGAIEPACRRVVVAAGGGHKTSNCFRGIPSIRAEQNLGEILCCALWWLVGQSRKPLLVGRERPRRMRARFRQVANLIRIERLFVDRCEERFDELPTRRDRRGIDPIRTANPTADIRREEQPLAHLPHRLQVQTRNWRDGEFEVLNEPKVELNRALDEVGAKLGREEYPAGEKPSREPAEIETSPAPWFAKGDEIFAGQRRVGEIKLHQFVR